MASRNLESYKKDIETIKHIIEKTKIDIKELALLFIAYGSAMLITYAVIYFQLLSARDYLHSTLARTFAYIQYPIFLLLFVFFIIKRKDLRRMNNPYTLQLCQIWGCVMFLFPLFNLISTMISSIVDRTHSNALLAIVCTIPSVIQVFSFFLATSYTGIILNKKWLTYTSFGFIAILFAIYCLGTFDITEPSIYFFSSYIGARTTYCQFIVNISYILLGIHFWTQKGSGHGIKQFS